MTFLAYKTAVWCTFCFKNLSKEIDNLLKPAPFFKIPSEHIFISSKNDEEHLKTLETALKIVLNNGLKLKQNKMYVYETWSHLSRLGNP